MTTQEGREEKRDGHMFSRSILHTGIFKTKTSTQTKTDVQTGISDYIRCKTRPWSLKRKDVKKLQKL
jgi:hypothetical protein